MATGEKSEDQAILRELCSINGVSYDNLSRGSGMKVTRLESFFFGCPYIPHGSMTFFPALKELRIINQNFKSISGLESCVNLTELWICEGELQIIDGLSQCVNLKSLYLYTNRISRIGGLSMLSKLEKLWLNGNSITCIEGLELPSLREMNLAHNVITTIGHTLDHLTFLEELNISGNKLSSLQDLVHLSSLPRLRSLSLCDPLYPPNPVCSLCNYSTHTLYHLPSLEWLDGVSVATDDLKGLIAGIVQRKKRFYQMKVHHVLMEARQTELKLRLSVDTAKTEAFRKISQIQRQLKTLEYYDHCVDDDNRRSSLKETMDKLDKHISSLDAHYISRCEEINSRASDLRERWTTELESGGNIRFMYGTSSQPWVQSCGDLVRSRFTVGTLQGVSGLEVTEVIKVENRLQYSRFNEQLRLELKREVFSSLGSEHSVKKLMDYLFVIWKPEETLIDLCRDTSTLEGTSCHMTNSVNLADRLRLTHIEQGQRPCNGELLLCKVFVGLTTETKSTKTPTQASHPDVNSVLRVGTQGEKEWFVMSRDLLIPEYIIHVKYITTCGDHMMSCDLPEVHPTCPSPSHPRLAMLDEVSLLERTGDDSLTVVKELCLHDNHLRRLRLASSLPSLVRLVLSFNELSTTDDLHNMPNLETLDLSFNKLTNLNGLKCLPKLKSVDFCCNELSGLHDVIAVLRKHTPCLEVLDLRYNPWTKSGDLRPYVLGRIKTLKVFNSRPVTGEELTLAIRGVVSSHLSLTTLMHHSHTHPHTPHTLTLGPLSEALHSDPHHRPTHLNPQTDWTQMVTSVCVSGMGLRKLTCLDHLPNLRWISLADNSLSSIEGLSGCSHLEELMLSNNLLEEVPSLHSFPELKWLSLANNKLATLPPLQPQLEYLDISYNLISSLEQLKHSPGLVELYASGNLVQSTRQLFPLKALSSLCVCDLTGNPATSLTVYRMFIIYHLASLKALDGVAVETSEVVTAREKMGGRLSQDLIYERHPNDDPVTFRQLDVTHCGIKHVDLSPVSVFDNLASLNLEHNSLTSFSRLIHLHKLKVLCLNHNRIEHLISPRDVCPDSIVMTNLEVLHLAYNGISNLSLLQLSKIPSLKALFLQGNEISRVEGMEGLELLTELVLDRNKIKALQPGSFMSLSGLRELHLEENRLKDLSHFSPLVNLQRLYLGMNKIQDFNHLEKLSCMVQLLELSVVSNPVSRRLQHRSLLVHHIPSLLSLDGVLVSADERQAADITFNNTQQDVEVPIEVGLSHGSLLKVMNVPFGHGHHFPSPAQRREPKTQLGAMEKRRGRR